MTFKIARTYTAAAPGEWELSVLATVDATIVSAVCLTEEALLDLAKDADVIVSGVREPFTRHVLEQLDRCRAITRGAVGYDNVDLQAATDKGIVISSAPDASVDEVSDQAMALILDCARKVTILADGVKAGKWVAGNFELARKLRPMFKLRGRVLGIVGLGTIGRAVVPKAQGFGMRVIAYDPWVPTAVAEPLGVELVSFDHLLQEADFITIHTPLTATTDGLFNATAFEKMKPTAYLINTSRGSVVDEAALFDAVSKGIIAGAGLDVLAVEPPGPDHPLFSLENVIITPHSAYYSETSVVVYIRRGLEDAVRVINGELPLHVVNREVISRLDWVKR